MSGQIIKQGPSCTCIVTYVGTYVAGKALDWLLGRILEVKLDPNPDQD